VTRVIQILLAAGFTVGLSAALGWMLLRRLRIRLFGQEVLLFSFVAGAASLSLATFALSVVHQARAGVFLAGGAPLIAWAAWRAWKEPRRKPLPAAPAIWQTIFFFGFALFLLIYSLNALAPEVSPDGAGYHLGNVRRMAEAHGFVWNSLSMYAFLSQGMEMLFLVAFCLGGHSAAALVHCAFLATLPLMMASFGRRFGCPRAAMCAGLLVFASPVVGLDGSSAYNDVALANLSFAAFYGFQLLDQNDNGNLLFLNGLFAGFCYAIKYTGGLTIALAMGWAGKPRRSLASVAAGAALAAGPWLIRNWIWLGNPTAPFLNRFFPNPHYYPGPEQSYLADLAHYEGLRHWWQVPVDVALHGGSITGILGPVFLLAPLALLALRRPLGRRLLVAAAVLAVPAWFNTGARFLIPALPFLALAMGLALENSWGALPALAAFQLCACWPSNLAAYAAPWSWRIREIPVQAAMRRQPEAAFLRDHLPDYAFKDAIERWVKPGEKIFSYAGRPDAYLDGAIVVGYESALGNLLEAILRKAVIHEPMVRTTGLVGGMAVHGVRVSAIKGAPAYWTVTGLRLASRGGEVPPAGWRFTAHPNPWQAALAFDGSPLLG